MTLFGGPQPAIGCCGVLRSLPGPFVSTFIEWTLLYAVVSDVAIEEIHGLKA